MDQIKDAMHNSMLDQKNSMSRLIDRLFGTCHCGLGVGFTLNDMSFNPIVCKLVGIISSGRGFIKGF